jgi:3-dehydroquinate dehydratase-1/3-dehydroquinate dehydratase/shikimate dehydrogenase
MGEGRVCVAVTGSDAAVIAEMVAPISVWVDVVEVRLDGMDSPDVSECCRLLQLPLLFTNRPVWEGGGFAGNEEERLQPLLSAIELQAAYVDLEFRAGNELRQQLLTAVARSSTRLIVSWHDFEETPGEDELSDILTQMKESGADIGKIITTAHDTADVLNVLELQKKANAIQFPLTTFCMGEVGRISRFSTLYLGGCMTYVAVSEEQATAPGQFSAQHFNQLRSLFAHVD